MIKLFQDHKQINVRFLIKIAAHFRSIQDDVLNLIAVLVTQARQVFCERLLLTQRQIIQAVTFHFISKVFRAITRR